MTDIREGVIVGLGNPLLDVAAAVTLDYLKKWNLKPNDAILADERHKELPDELKKLFPVKFIAGGSAQNTLRTAQWVLRKYPKACVMMGSIGEDFFGKCMQARAEEDGLKCEYMIKKDIPTGICSVLISDSGKNRSMVADLAAANHFEKEFLLSKWSNVENARICYATGFHLTVCPEGELEVAQYCSKHDDKIFIFNLSAPFISQVFGKEVEKVSPYANVIFGNESEALAYADLKKYKNTDQMEIAKLIASEPRANENKPRIVIITQGSDPIVVAYVLPGQELKTLRHDVPELNKEEIVDTNGAGDASSGGFLGALVLNNYELSEKSIRQCLTVACYTAREIIKQDGCSIPTHDVPLSIIRKI